MIIENYMLKDDVKLVCFEARSFPDGVQEAFRILDETLPDSVNRKLFGISFPGEDGRIVYKAAAQESIDGEALNLGRESFTVRSGSYISVFIKDFMDDESGLGNAFHELLADPRIDPNGSCVEMYVGEKDVRCMVRLDPMKVEHKTETA